VDTALADTPAGVVTDRAHALHVVEAIELLLDADQWKAADDLYLSRTANGEVWKHLPAAGLGQRATAFVATPDRRQACRTHLAAYRLGWYLNEVGLFALYAGTPAFWPSVCRTWPSVWGGSGTPNPRSPPPRKPSPTPPPPTTADRSSRHTATGGGWPTGWRHPAAEQHFLAADHIQHTDDPDGAHLSSIWGVWWAGLLARTGRPGPARRLTTANLTICHRNGWNDDATRCRVMLARLDLADQAFDTAGQHVEAALRIFRDGDYLLDMAEALTVSADHARHTGEFDRAADHLAEALTLTAPRHLTPTHTAGLTARALLAADRHAATGDPRHLFEGRDAADAALRLATGAYPLPWQQLAALRAHAHLDHATHTHYGWAGKAEQLLRRLVPAALDPAPLATIEDQIRRERRT
jgi:hypothetical protein